jgi:hypothetical protein
LKPPPLRSNTAPAAAIGLARAQRVRACARARLVSSRLGGAARVVDDEVGLPAVPPPREGCQAATDHHERLNVAQRVVWWARLGIFPAAASLRRAGVGEVSVRRLAPGRHGRHDGSVCERPPAPLLSFTAGGDIRQRTLPLRHGSSWRGAVRRRLLAQHRAAAAAPRLAAPAAQLVGGATDSSAGAAGAVARGRRVRPRMRPLAGGGGIRAPRIRCSFRRPASTAADDNKTHEKAVNGRGLPRQPGGGSKYSGGARRGDTRRGAHAAVVGGKFRLRPHRAAGAARARRCCPMITRSCEFTPVGRRWRRGLQRKKARGNPRGGSRTRPLAVRVTAAWADPLRSARAAGEAPVRGTYEGVLAVRRCTNEPRHIAMERRRFPPPPPLANVHDRDERGRGRRARRPVQVAAGGGCYAGVRPSTRAPRVGGSEVPRRPLSPPPRSVRHANDHAPRRLC